MVIILYSHLPTEHLLSVSRTSRTTVGDTVAGPRARGTVYRLLEDRSPVTGSLGNI